MDLIDELKDVARTRNIKDSEQLQPVISEKLAELLQKDEADSKLNIQNLG